MQNHQKKRYMEEKAHFAEKLKAMEAKAAKMIEEARNAKPAR